MCVCESSEMALSLSHSGQMERDRGCDEGEWADKDVEASQRAN